MSNQFPLLGYILVGAAVAFPLLQIAIRLAPRLGFIDWPKSRGISENQVPIVGHSLVATCLVVMMGLQHYYHFNPWIIVTSALMALMGHFDDRKARPALDKLFFQLVCVGCAVIFVPGFEGGVGTLAGWKGYVGTGLFIVMIVNAINFIDGIDGLAGIVIFFGAAGLLFINQHFLGPTSDSILAAFITGMMLPFVYFNLRKRKGFLGNVGSYFFSFLLGVMHTSVPVKSDFLVSRLSLSALFFLIPIGDLCMVVFSRLISYRSPFEADKGHFHHRLLQSYLPLKWVLPCFGFIELSGFIQAAALVHWQSSINLMVSFVFISHVVMLTFFILLLERTSARRLSTVIEAMLAGQSPQVLQYLVKPENGKNMSRWRLRRLQDRMITEIRVTDFCFTMPPNSLFLILHVSEEALISTKSRLEKVFVQEGLAFENERYTGLVDPRFRATLAAIRKVA